MPKIKPTLRRATLLFGGWTVVGLIFAAVSYGIAMSESNSRFGLAEALKLNLVQFYLWGIFSPLVFGFSRRFPNRGGGMDNIIANYERGLAICAKPKAPDDPLEPSWGKPELMMSLAYTQLTKTPPDVEKAERNVRGALEIVPYWHYARDILLKQIAEAKAKQSP
jgi:hypothetical protein